MSVTLYIGIDISLRKGMVAFLTSDGLFQGKPFEIDNNPAGFDLLRNRILAVSQSAPVHQVFIGLEASSNYSFHLLDYFNQHPLPLATKPYLINPKYIRRFKGAFPEQEKTDLVDAQFIAEYLRFGRLPVEYRPERLQLPLQRLVRYRYHLVKSVEREKKIFLANLFLLFPAWVQQRPLKPYSATALAALNQLTIDEIAEAPLEELAAFVAAAGKNRFPDPLAVAESIQKAARESYRLRPALASSCQFILASITRTLATLKQTIAQFDRAIADEGGAFLNPLLSIKGIGPVYAAGILASVGNIKRFHSHNQLARYAGLTWKRIQSGQTEAPEKRLVRECDKYLRYYLIQAANSLRVHNEVFQRYYQKKYQEVPSHQHKRALVLTARKLVRLVFALLSKNQLYDQSRVVQSPAGA